MNHQITIKTLAQECLKEIIDIRRHIHAHPELSFKENETSALVASKLKEYGIEYKSGYGGYGILGVIHGNGKGKTVALRGDMDALPINEENDLPFKSINKGVMHACGHDIHTSCLLGAAKILNEMRQHWSGTILLIFQPGEEKIPGGAKLMMEQGLFDHYTPDLIIGQHVYPELPAGHVGFKQGQYMASADEIYITLHGKGGHAALPHRTIDTVLMAAQTVVTLQQVVSRIIPTQVPAVLSFGNIVCNSAMNIIPETIRLEGTFRTMNEEWRYMAHEKIRKLTQSVVDGMGGSADIDIQIGFPSVYNNPEVTRKAHDAAIDFLGNNMVHNLDIRMTAEDFGWFAQKYPACFYRLGVAFGEKESAGLHSPKFVANEEAIETGMQVMAYLAIDALK